MFWFRIFIGRPNDSNCGRHQSRRGDFDKLLGTSAWYAPGAAVSALVQAIACDQKKMFPCSALLEGEYGLNDISIGVPCVLGKSGIERIVEIELARKKKLG